MEDFGYKDQVHGYISLPGYMKRFIDVPEFQRLENIKQLGSVHKVYRGAKHDRLSHCIGTAYLAHKMAKRIQSRYPELNVSDIDVFLVTIAGLYHDIGHGPYSHLFEEFMSRRTGAMDFNHEDTGCTIISTKLKYLFQEHFEIYHDKIATVLAMIKGDYNQTERNLRPGKEFLFQIVHNSKTGIDVDKCDYYIRDSYNAGVKVTYNADRLQECFLIVDGEIIYKAKEYHNIYEFFHTRNVLHATVYNHRVCWQIDEMILEILNEGAGYFEPFITLEDFLNMDDSIVNEIGKTTNSLTWARLQERRLYKTVIELHPRDILNVKKIEHIITDEIKGKRGYRLVSKKIGFEEHQHPLKDMVFLGKNNTKVKVNENSNLPRDHDVYILRLITSLEESEYSQVEKSLVSKLGFDQQQIFY